MAAAARNAAAREAMEEADLAVDPATLVWFAHWTPGAARRRDALRRGSSWRGTRGCRSPSTTARSTSTSGSGPADAHGATGRGRDRAHPADLDDPAPPRRGSRPPTPCAAARSRDPQIYLTHITRGRRRHRLDLAGRRRLRRPRHRRSRDRATGCSCSTPAGGSRLLTRRGQMDPVPEPGPRQTRRSARVPGACPRGSSALSPQCSPPSPAGSTAPTSGGARRTRRRCVTAVALLAVACSDSGALRPGGDHHAAGTAAPPPRPPRPPRRRRRSTPSPACPGCPTRRTSTARPETGKFADATKGALDAGLRAEPRRRTRCRSSTRRRCRWSTRSTSA